MFVNYRHKFVVCKARQITEAKLHCLIGLKNNLNRNCSMNMLSVLYYISYEDKLVIKHHAMMMYGGVDL